MNKDLILRERLAIQRTHLANQTTFLAFLRTAMYFFVAGLSIDSFFSFRRNTSGHVVVLYGCDSIDTIWCV
jgi:putative membrane protein